MKWYFLFVTSLPIYHSFWQPLTVVAKRICIRPWMIFCLIFRYPGYVYVSFWKFTPKFEEKKSQSYIDENPQLMSKWTFLHCYIWYFHLWYKFNWPISFKFLGLTNQMAEIIIECNITSVKQQTSLTGESGEFSGEFHNVVNERWSLSLAPPKVMPSWRK